MALGGAMSMSFDIFGNDKTASKALDGVGKKADQTGGRLSGIGSKAKSAGRIAAVGIGAASAAVGALAVGGYKAIQAAEGQAAADAKLAQVFKSMGYPRHAKSALDYANALESTIAVDSEVIEGAQAKLATFDDIAKSTGLMARTTKLAADMSAAGFGDMGSASVGLGKALQDPITGMSLLSKQGSLTKAQQKEIGDEFKRTGDKGKAQESILKALEKQVGGVAEASATGSAKMGIAFDNVVESVGMALMPAFEKLAPVVAKVADFFVEKVIPALQKFAKDVGPKVRDLFDGIKKTVEDNRPALEKLGDIIGTVAGFIATKIIPALLKWEGFMAKNLIKALAAIGNAIPPVVSFVLRGVAQIVRGFGDFYSAVTGVLEGILTVAEKTLGWIPGIGDKIKTAKAGFASFRDDSVQKLRDVASGLETAAGKVDAFGAKARALPETRLKADITDLKSKIETAKTELANPNLTRDRKAELKADIADLREKVREAKGKLDEVRSKNVQIGVDLRFSKSGTNTIRLPSGKVVPLAQGGIVKRRPGGIIAQIGEGRYDEAVIPLKPGAAKPGAYGAGDTYHIAVSGGLGDREQVARDVQRALLDLKRRGGASLGLA